MGCSPHWEEAPRAPGAGSRRDRQILRPERPHHRVGFGAAGRPLLPGQKAEARGVSSWRGGLASHILQTRREIRVNNNRAAVTSITFFGNNLFTFFQLID